MRTIQAVSALTLLLLASAAIAHEGSGAAGGYASGFMHPLHGWDHMAAMVAVGLWGTCLGRSAMLGLLIAFPLMMALGGGLGVMGTPVPVVEAGIAASAVVLGVMVAIMAKPPLWVAGLTVAAFGIFHGHAHGTELPAAANALTYSLGFISATILLHLGGISFGLLVRWPAGKLAVQASGGLIALAGVAFLTGTV